MVCGAKMVKEGVGKRIVIGAGLQVASRMVTRCIDLVALVVLAHLLSPADFGLVAIAMSVVMIVEAIMEMPLGLALVALPVRHESHYETVFTLQLMRGLILASVLIASTWPLSHFYGDDRLIGLVCALAIAPMSRGMANPKMIEFSLKLNFLPSAIVEVSGKVVAFALSVSCAWLTNSYWALPIATIAGPVVMLIVSYILAPYWPRISLRRWSSFSSYVGWSALGQTIRSIMWQMDPLLLGRLVGQSELGGFSMAANIASLPSQIFVEQTNNPLVVAFSRLRDDVPRLRAAYLKSAASIAAFGLPIMVGLALTAGPLVSLVFGEKWQALPPVLQGLAVAVVPSFLTAPFAALAIAVERPRVITRVVIIEFIVRLPIVLFGAMHFGVIGVVIARIVVAIIVLCIVSASVTTLIGLGPIRQLLAFWRQIMSVAVMAAFVWSMQWMLDQGGPQMLAAVRFGALVLSSAVVYAASLFALWHLSGKPDGLESYIRGFIVRSVP